MNTLLSLVRTFVPDGLLRAKVLAAIRAASLMAGAAVLTIAYGFITTHFKMISEADATAIATTLSTCAAGLVLTIGAAVFQQLDPVKVDREVKSAHAAGVAIAAKAISAGTTTPEEITAASGTPMALAELIAKLKAGQQ